MHWLLFYGYVDDIAERRGPFREEHLALVRETAGRGTLLLAGAFADPLDGAVFVFAADDQSAVEDFVGRDPYVREGLVTEWRIRAWTLVAGAERLS